MGTAVVGIVGIMMITKLIIEIRATRCIYIFQVKHKSFLKQQLRNVYNLYKAQKMSQSQGNRPNQVTQEVQKNENLNNMTSSIQPTHAEKKNPGIIQSHTNFTDHPSEQTNQIELETQQKIQSIGDQPKLVDDKTASEGLDKETRQIIQEIFKPEPIKKQQASVQVGGGKNVQVLKNTEETYAPQSCQIHVRKQNEPELKTLENEDIMEGGSGEGKNTRSQVQIQVGVSLLDEPEKIINVAKQQRILSDHEKYSKFIQNQKLMSQNQKSVYTHMYESIQSKKTQILSWHDILKDHFTRYASIMKDFSEKCEKSPKQEKVDQSNKYLNIGQQLKDGYNELVNFRQASGYNHRNMSEYTHNKTIKDLQRAYSNYTNEMGSSLSAVNDKKKVSLKIEEELKKQGSKVQKMFSRTKQGKKQEDDFFIQLSKTITLQQRYRISLSEWGQQISLLKKSLISFTENYCNEVQQIFNAFKNQSNTLYGIQKIKYDKIRNSKTQIIQDTAYNKLIILVDSDYIRCSLESALKKQVTQITDKQFDEFTQIPQGKLLLGQPRQLLMNMIVKKFNLKDKTQQLIHTVSGNLVLYNKETLECSEKMQVKNIKTALTVQEGAIEIEQKVYGVIFASKKKIKIEFQDSDRAEELVCFLGQGETSNN